MAAIQKVHFLLFLAVLLSLFANAQTGSLQPSFENPYNLNPAFPASPRYNRLVANYISSPSSSGLNEAHLSYNSSCESLGGSIGVMADYISNLNSKSTLTTLNGFYAYKLTIKDERRKSLYINAGTGIGMTRLADSSRSGYVVSMSPGVIISTRRLYSGFGFYYLPVYHKKVENINQNGTFNTYNAFAGAWLPIDNWKRVPEEFLSPNITYCSEPYNRSLAAGAYFAWHWLMPGVFYEYSSANNTALRLSIGLKKNGWRLHLVADVVRPEKNYDIPLVEATLTRLFFSYKYTHSRRKWRNRDMIYCPATW
jgi:hypothetical protein